MAIGLGVRRWEFAVPDRRTLAGLALGAAAAVLVLVVTRPATTVPVLVADSDLPAGTALRELDVGVRRVTDPTGLVAGDDLGELADWYLARPVAAGEPLVPSLLEPPAVATAPARMALSVDAAHAVLGRLSPGDRIDVYRTTAPPGEPPVTERIASGVFVIDATVRPSPTGGDRVDLLLAVDDATAALLTAAGHGDGIDIVRVGP